MKNIVRMAKCIGSVVMAMALIFAAVIYCGRGEFKKTAAVGDDSSQSVPLHTVSIEYDESQSGMSGEGESIGAATEKSSYSTDKSTTTQSATTTTITTTATTSTTTSTTAKTTTLKYTQSPDFSKSSYINSVVSITNQKRIFKGRSRLKTDSTLMSAAQTRAEECAAAGTIRINGKSHTRPDGSEWYTVFGITENYNYGENTGQGCDTPEYMMDIWMDSTGHRDNILRADYTKIGVGCAVGYDGTVFCVQLFYRP